MNGDLYKFFNGTLTDFKTWLASQDDDTKTKLSKRIVLIYQNEAHGWMYAFGNYYHMSSTGMNATVDGEYVIITDGDTREKVITLNRKKMILNGDCDTEEGQIKYRDNGTLITLGGLKDILAFESIGNE